MVCAAYSAKAYLNRPAETHRTGDARKGCRIICQIHLPLQHEPHFIAWPRKLQILPCSSTTPNPGKIGFFIKNGVCNALVHISQIKKQVEGPASSSVQDLVDIIACTDAEELGRLPVRWP